MPGKRPDVTPADKKAAESKYGDVPYADETNKKYPIDTEEHIRAAWNYINKEKNAAKYDSGEVKSIKSKIISAWKKKIDKKGPPSAEMSETIEAPEVVIFRAGDYPQGKYTEADLDEMVESFDANDAPHVIIGHSSDYKGHTRIPSFGRIVGGLKRVGKDLVAMGVQFNQDLVRWIKQGYYEQRSIELSDDPKTGKKRILALGILGAAPPAVKGLPSLDESLDEIALSFSEEAETTVVEFTDSEPIDFDYLEAAAKANTFQQIAEHCQKFLDDIDSAMNAEEPDEDDMRNSMYALQSNIAQCLGMQSAFQSKADEIKKGFMEKAAEMAEKFLTKHSRKDVAMEAKEKQDLLDQIAAKDAKIKEFAEKERVAKEAEAKAKEDAADEKIRGEVKAFCQEMKTAGKYVEADEKAGLPELMFTLAKAGKSYKEFFTNRQIVPMGLTKDVDKNVDSKNDESPKVIRDAVQYVKDHPKEFSGMDIEAATARAVYLYSTGKIKFTGK